MKINCFALSQACPTPVIDFSVGRQTRYANVIINMSSCVIMCEEINVLNMVYFKSVYNKKEKSNFCYEYNNYLIL